MDSPRRRQIHNPPTERTPLLANPHSDRSLPSQDPAPVVLAHALPNIGPFVAEVRLDDLPKYSIDNLYPPTLRSRPTQIAFSLCALLYLRSYLREASLRGRDVWAQWRQGRRNNAGVQSVDSLLIQVWERFLSEDGCSEDVRDVLWSAYPLYPDSTQSIRGKQFCAPSGLHLLTPSLVVDFLASGEGPTQLLNHPLIHASAVDTWKHGLFEGCDNEGVLSRLLYFLDSTGSPRWAHNIYLSEIYAC